MSGFVDVRAAATCKAGDGGAGLRRVPARSRTSRRAAPTAATAASGGDVWLRANRNVASLLAFRDHPHRKATSGTHGSGKKQHGSAGADLVVDVPEGTVVRGSDGELLADLVTRRRPLARGARRAGWARQRAVPVERSPRADRSPSRASTAKNAGCSSS